MHRAGTWMRANLTTQGYRLSDASDTFARLARRTARKQPVTT